VVCLLRAWHNIFIVVQVYLYIMSYRQYYGLISAVSSGKSVCYCILIHRLETQREYIVSCNIKIYYCQSLVLVSELQDIINLSHLTLMTVVYCHI